MILVHRNVVALRRNTTWFVSFVAVDARNGLSPTANVRVNLCDCAEQAVCDFEGDDDTQSDLFRVALCECNGGWTGG